jgi:DNA-binding MarR family transcriptional regulator
MDRVIKALYYVNMIDQKRQAELREAIELFFFAYRAFTTQPDRILAERGLGRVHHRILYFVAHNPYIRVSELLRILDVSKQALNAPLRQLLELELVDMKVATHDRRVKQLRLTPEGERLEALLTGTQMQHLEAVLGNAGEVTESAWKAIMRQMPLVAGAD